MVVFYLILFSPPTSRVLLRLQCPQVPDSSPHRDMFGLIIIKRLKDFLTKNITADRGPLSIKLDMSIEQKKIQPTCGVPLQPAASSDARSVASQTL